MLENYNCFQHQIYQYIDSITDLLYSHFITSHCAAPMKYNIVDIVHLLTLIAQEPEQLSGRRMSKSKSTHSANSYPIQLISRNQNPGNKPVRQSTQKHSKKQNTLFEVADNRKIILHQNLTASSFTFDRIEQAPNKFDNLIDWMLNQNKSADQLEMSVSCKLIVSQNFSRADCYTAIETIGKTLISEGISFQLITQFYTATQEKYMNGEIHRQRRQSYDPYYQDSARTSGGINKKIRFVSDLKQHLNDIKSICQNISRFWVLSPIGLFGVSMIWSSAKKDSYVDSIEQMINDYILLREVKSKKVINIKIAISTVCQTPHQNNLQPCKFVLENSLLIRNQVMNFAMKQKICPANQNMEKEDYALKDISNQKSDKKMSRKSSKVQVEQKSTKIQSFPKKIKQSTSSEQSESGEENSLVRNILTKTSKPKGMDISQNGIASILAENMNLKWQLATKQKQFSLQSQKFIEKMNKKMESMREERSFIIQESARLRKDNETLMAQISSLKLEYQAIIKTRGDYERMMEDKLKINHITMQEASSAKIKELSEQVKLLQDLKQNLEAQISNMKISLEDARKRNREKLEEMSEQINQYKQFCEELKVAYDDLQRQAILDQDRCQNLQKRCKKYQETLSGLMEIKAGSPTVNIDEITSSKTSVLIQQPFMNELESRKTEGQGRTKIKKWEERPESMSMSIKSQSRKSETKKSSKVKRKQMQGQSKQQILVHRRQVTFADSQSKFQ